MTLLLHVKACNLATLAGSAKKLLDMYPSLASLGDGLPSRAGSQRDEAKMHAADTTKS